MATSTSARPVLPVFPVVSAILLTLLLAGCGQTAGPPASTRPAPVVTRIVELARGPDRPLPVTLWYRRSLAGRRPIVLVSHGLRGLPRQFAPLAVEWAEAGYVVAAPAYPQTNGRLTVVNRADVPNQSIDAVYVLGRVKAFDQTPGDPLAGHLATGRVALVGFSASATTTLGALTARHDPAIRAAVSIAGRLPRTAFGGPPVPVLFIHGTADPTVPYAAGRTAYRALPWPKEFVTVTGEGHGPYLRPGDAGYPLVSDRIRSFLQAHLGRSEVPSP